MPNWKHIASEYQKAAAEAYAENYRSKAAQVKTCRLYAYARHALFDLLKTQPDPEWDPIKPAYWNDDSLGVEYDPNALLGFKLI